MWHIAIQITRRRVLNRNVDSWALFELCLHFKSKRKKDHVHIQASSIKYTTEVLVISCAIVFIKNIFKSTRLNIATKFYK